MPTKECKTLLKKKIKKNIEEMKKGRFKNVKQAIAVSYSQMPKKCGFKRMVKGEGSSMSKSKDDEILVIENKGTHIQSIRREITKLEKEKEFLEEKLSKFEEYNKLPLKLVNDAINNLLSGEKGVFLGDFSTEVAMSMRIGRIKGSIEDIDKKIEEYSNILRKIRERGNELNSANSSSSSNGKDEVKGGGLVFTNSPWRKDNTF